MGSITVIALGTGREDDVTLGALRAMKAGDRLILRTEKCGAAALLRREGIIFDTLDDLYVHDALTGLYNRFGLSRYGQQRYDDLLASSGSVQVLFIDMDDMKSINDRFGHEAGDAALKVTARLLQDVCSPEAFIMRYGGDEFIIIDSGLNDDLHTDILKAAEQYNTSSGMPFTLGFSITCWCYLISFRCFIFWRTKSISFLFIIDLIIMFQITTI